MISFFLQLAHDYPHDALSFKDYSLIVENSEIKSRIAFYIWNGISFTRKVDLELEGKYQQVIQVLIGIQKLFEILPVFVVEYIAKSLGKSHLELKANM